MFCFSFLFIGEDVRALISPIVEGVVAMMEAEICEKVEGKDHDMSNFGFEGQ